MSTRRIFTLIVVLGLAMVWLGFLFTYELKVAAHTPLTTEQLAEAPTAAEQAESPALQTAGLKGSDAVAEAGLGFPIILAGLGLVFVLGGVFSYRSREIT